MKKIFLGLMLFLFFALLHPSILQADDFDMTFDDEFTEVFDPSIETDSRTFYTPDLEIILYGLCLAIVTLFIFLIVNAVRLIKFRKDIVKRKTIKKKMFWSIALLCLCLFVLFRFILSTAGMYYWYFF